MADIIEIKQSDYLIEKEDVKNLSKKILIESLALANCTIDKLLEKLKMVMIIPVVRKDE